MAYGTQTNSVIPSLFYFHKGKTVASRVGSQQFDMYLLSIDYSLFDVGALPIQYAHRPDLIANLWYGSSFSWWKVMAVNGIFDPFQSLVAGAPILVPKG